MLPKKCVEFKKKKKHVTKFLKAECTVITVFGYYQMFGVINT